MRFSVQHIPSTDSFEVTSPDLDNWRKVAVGAPGLANAVLTGMRALKARSGSSDGRYSPQGVAAGPFPPPQPATVTADDVLELPLSLLFVDPAYQRPLDTRRVAKMAADFDPALVGVLEVSDRGDESFAIVDGQHRWALLLDVAAEGHDPTVPCKVHRGLSLDDEAALFSDIDASRRSLTGWDRWCARRGAGDPVVLDVERAIEACGLKTGRLAQPGTVRTTGTCESIYDAGGSPLLVEVLQLCVDVWNDDPEALIGSILGGFALLLRTYARADLDLDRLVRQLQPRTVRQIHSLIATKRELIRGESATLAAAVFVDLYNQGDRSGRLDARLVHDKAMSRPGAQPGHAPVRTRECPGCGGQIIKKHTRGRWPSLCIPCRDARRAGRTSSAA